MTVIERRLYAATGGDSGSLPILLPGLGVPGIAHQWDASMLGAVGSSVATWEPYTGSLALNQATTAARPIVASGLGGRKVLRFDGADDTMSAGGLLTGSKTMSLLLRSTEPAGTTKALFSWDGGYARRGSTGNTASTRIGASNITVPVDPTQPLFHVVTVINDFAGGVGATAVDGVYMAQATDRENKNLILGIASSAYGAVEILRVATWGRALTEAECQTARAGFQAAYPGLVA